MATINKRGPNRWRAQVRRKGTPPRSRTFERKEDARRWADKVEGAIASDDFIDLSEAKRTTLGEILERYLAEVTPTKKGAKQERNRIRQWLDDPLASRPLAAIRSTDIAAWRTSRVALNKAPTTVKNALTIISHVYKVAASEWGMEGLRNPVAGVRMPKSRPPRDRRLEPGEEQRLLEACEQVGSRLLGPIAAWAIETAMRQGEILALERAYVRGKVAFLRDTKNGQARSVPLSTRALAIIYSVPVALRGRVFPITQDSLEYYWRRACELAAIEDLHFHDLRHEATSRLFERGLNHFEVMAITGHGTTDMLKRYTHFRAEELAAKLG